MEYKLKVIIIGVALLCLSLAVVASGTIEKKVYINGSKAKRASVTSWSIFLNQAI